MVKKQILKIITAGDGGVGKTTLLRRYVEGLFYSGTQLTVGVEFFTKEIILNNLICALQLWDFGGQERFRFMLDSYTIGAKGAILMFDLTRMSTLNSLKEWVGIMRKYNTNLPILFVGTKNDLIEKISVEDSYILEMKDKYNFFDYIKISSKTGENVDAIFTIITNKLIGTN